MANALYDWGREAFLMGDVAWDSDETRLILIDEGADSIDLVNDDNLDDRAAGARIAVMSTGMTGKTSVGAGVADATDVVFPTVSGVSVESIDCYKHTGVESTSRLLFNLDTGTGLPVTPNGGDITVVFDSGANRIFKL